MRTTAVRRLLPEAWGKNIVSFVAKFICSFIIEGFLCPVHTPDGAPCGLLNHLAANAKVEPSFPFLVYLCVYLCQFLV